MTASTPAPISKNATGVGSLPRRNTGTASKNPMKNTSAGARTYDGLTTWVENSSVQGTVISQPHTSHRGTCGTRSQTYHANHASAPNESRFTRTNGDSGTGTIRSGRLTRTP